MEPREPTTESRSERRARAWAVLHGEPIDDVAAMAFHLRARAILSRVIARLDAAGIPALVVKGAVLAHWLYESPIDRPIRDVDLRVRPRDLARAVRVLTSAPGTRLLVASRVYRNATLSVDRVEVDIESTIGPPFVCAIDVDAMLARAERTDAGLGFSHLRPELHDHALLLIVNLFKDRFVDPPGSRVRDLELIARQPGFDASTLEARAADARCRTITHVVARYVAEVTDDDRWRAIAERIPPTRARYADRVLARLRSHEPDDTVAWRLGVRACSDDRLRAFGALGTSALREIELATEQRFG